MGNLGPGLFEIRAGNPRPIPAHFPGTKSAPLLFVVYVGGPFFGHRNRTTIRPIFRRDFSFFRAPGCQFPGHLGVAKRGGPPALFSAFWNGSLEPRCRGLGNLGAHAFSAFFTIRRFRAVSSGACGFGRFRAGRAVSGGTGGFGRCGRSRAGRAVLSGFGRSRAVSRCFERFRAASGGFGRRRAVSCGVGRF